MANTTYKQPVNVPIVPTAGYPQTDIGKDGTMTKGRWMAGVGQKSYIDGRGVGAATKGKKFLNK